MSLIPTIVPIGIDSIGMFGHNAYARGIERDCTKDANRYYQDKFHELGCALKPGSSTSAIVEILDAQKLQKGAGLEPATGN
jgi:hypothetical protein